MAKNDHIRAAAYVRKSTIGQNADGSERQEKSIPQQVREVARLKPAIENATYEVVRQYADPGKSGWKRGAARPDFARLLAEVAKHRDIEAILVDDLDRFSRATIDEVWTDINALRTAGVKWVHAANQGVFDIRNVADPGMVYRLTAGAMSSNDFSRRLSRRVTRNRRDLARDGKRSGGAAPFGLKNDGLGGLKRDDDKPARVKIVKRIFEEYLTGHSMNGVAERLNRDGLKAPRGGLWHNASIREILTQPAYKGAFAYNRQQSGQFHILDAAGEVVDADQRTTPAWQRTGDAAIIKEGVYKNPIIKPADWDRVQRRLAANAQKSARVQQDRGYPLAGVIFCGRCGKVLHGGQPRRDHNGPRVYARSRNAGETGDCQSHQIRESVILPYILKLMGEELDHLDKVQSPRPPVAPAHADHRAELEAERARLRAKIAQATERILDTADRRTRADLDARVSTMRDELDELDAKIDSDADLDAIQEADWERMSKFWRELKRTGLKVPITDKVAKASRDTRLVGRGADGQWWTRVNPLALRHALHTLGAKVTLFWERRGRHNVLVNGRFQLGQKTGKIPRHVLQGTACGRC
jgi:DNA invertase Pin-like site-specific DNA recombinase